MTSGPIAWKKNLRLAALGGFLLLASMVGLSAPHLPSQLLQFVAEHGNIAAALVRGDGFADPFGTPSGPTAWTPPVFACYLAGVFAVFGIKTLTSAWVLLVLDSAFAGLCVLCTAAALDLCGHAALKSWFALSLVGLTWIHEGALGPWFSTAWFVIALDSAFLLGAAGACRTGQRCWWWLLALTSGILVLTHAGSGAACIALLLVLWLLAAIRAAREQRISRWLALRRESGRPLAALAVCAVALGAWTARNWVVFHQVIPLKSTGWFEIYLAETYTTDGVIDDAVIIAHHPFSNPRLLVDYTLRGESAFLADYRVKARALLAADPHKFIHDVGGRALAAFSYCDTAPHVYQCLAGVGQGDAVKLVADGLAARFTAPLPLFWTSLDLSPQAFEKRVGQLGLAAPQPVTRDWLNAKSAMLDGESQPRRILSGIALAGLPSACLLGTLALRRRNSDRYFLFCALFYVVALLPNVLITHYVSHQLHFLGLHAFFIVSFAGAVGRPWRPRKGAGPP